MNKMKEEKQFIGEKFDKVKHLLNNKGKRTTKNIFKRTKRFIVYPEDPTSGKTIVLNCEINEIDKSTETIFNAEGIILSLGNTKETIDHKKVTKYTTLSITGSFDDCYGQIYDELEGFAKTIPTLKRIIEIWKQHHLNNLSAGCIHQKEVNTNSDDWDKLAEIETKKCPKKYRYGSKWLITPLSEDILTEIQALFTNKA